MRKALVNGRQEISVLIRQFLTAASEIHNREVREAAAAAYEFALADLPVEELRWALNETLRQVPYWPAPAHVRQQFDRRGAGVRKTTADQAWLAVRSRLEDWHYDPGIDGGPWLPRFSMRHPGAGYTGRVTGYNGGHLIGPPRLDPAIERAVQRVGGWDRLMSLDDKAHDFVRRDFIEAHQQAAEAHGHLPDDEAQSVLEQMHSDLAAQALKDQVQCGK